MKIAIADRVAVALQEERDRELVKTLDNLADAFGPKTPIGYIADLVGGDMD